MRQQFRVDRWIVQPSLNRIRSASRSPGAGAPESRQLGHKVMAVLVCLAERAGEVVTREELFERVWGGAFATDEALATVVYELRKALDDDARRPRYVETIRKRGYRLIAPIEPLAAETTPRHAGRRRVIHSVLPAAALTAAALTFMALLPGTWPGPGGSPAPGSATPVEPRAIQSLAVRPLSSFTDECRQDFFAGGLTEMLIADLVHLGPLDVIPALNADSSAMPGDPRQGAELRADAVLEGSVLRSGNRLWISIQLVDNADGHILWGGTFERELGASLDLQLELSREISYQIVSNVASPAEPPAPGSGP